MPYMNLKEKMAGRNVKIEDIALLLGIHRNSASNKVNGTSSFSIDESIKVRNAFFPDMDLDYLFSTEQSEEKWGELDAGYYQNNSRCWARNMVWDSITFDVNHCI